MPVVGYERAYEVSSLGRVRRIGRGRGVKTGRIKAASKINSGYYICALSLTNRNQSQLIHRIVAAAFIGACPSGHEVNHKNLDKSDNRTENLEYVTRSENVLHRAALGIGRGESNGAARLTEADIRDIRRRYRHGGGPGYKALAKDFGVSWGAIRDIIKRKVWAWMA